MTSNSKELAWKTKYGRRRVRREVPTLGEAIFAAQGISDDIDEQADIAASLMGLPLNEVRAALAKSPAAKSVNTSVAFTGPASAPRTVVVERKPSRRLKPTAQPQTGEPSYRQSSSPR
jgi:hypothetical protein